MSEGRGPLGDHINKGIPKRKRSSDIFTLVCHVFENTYGKKWIVLRIL